jgi:hypothetical protein
MKIEYTLPGYRARGPKTGMISPLNAEHARPPRVTCIWALSHRFEGLVRSGEGRDYAGLARVGRVSRARVSQILKLLTLAPSIQEYLLWLPPRTVGKEGITERDLRQIVREVRWDRQRLLLRNWCAAMDDPPSSLVLRQFLSSRIHLLSPPTGAMNRHARSCASY